MGKYQLRNTKTTTSSNGEESEHMATGDVVTGEANMHAPTDTFTS